MSVVNPYEQSTWLEKCTRFELVHFCGLYLIFSAGVLDFCLVLAVDFSDFLILKRLIVDRIEVVIRAKYGRSIYTTAEVGMNSQPCNVLVINSKSFLPNWQSP